ncbi:MAG: ABC transporter permease [Verrucomicrobiota bacterium]
MNFSSISIKGRYSALIAYMVMFISIPIVWLIAVQLSDLPSVILPPPSKVWAVLTAEFSSLWYHTGVTIGEAVLGYAVANVIAIFLAVLFIYSPWTEHFVTPWMVLIRNVPFVTVASILIVTLGDGLGTKVIVVVLVSFFPLLANLVKGLNSAPPELIDRMKVMNASRWQVFKRVLWPAALPYYVAAHEIAFTGSIIGAIVAEWFFARKGLGFLIVQSTIEYRADRLYAVTLIASLLAIAAYLLCKLWEHWVFRWKRR